MMTFSDDPQIAENQMHAIIFYLTAFGYIDGDFAPTEKNFVKRYIRQILETRVHDAMINADEATRAGMVEEYSEHFLDVFDHIDGQVHALFDEVVAQGENSPGYVYSRLKLRAFEIFKTFDTENQVQLLDTLHELIMADGVAHPSELAFRDEVTALINSEIPLESTDLLPVSTGRMELASVSHEMRPRTDDHPLFSRIERHYSPDPSLIAEQVAVDGKLIEATRMTWEDQRVGHYGRLIGKQTVADLSGEPAFLDSHVYALMPQPGKSYELVVLGDLHGCYSCFKAALLQSDFFAKVEAFKQDPRRNPDIKLVLLGDYIDRGIYSYDGVLRTAMQLFVHMPEHVYVLRGNHEYYLEYKGRIMGGVRPAEAISTLQPYFPSEMFHAYMQLFDAMPNMLLFDQFLFVHAGIPRDNIIAERWRDLSTLNDPDIRFQMMWSDPSEAEFVPPELQESSRFAFGRRQFRNFMARLGTTTMVRGHEKIDEGFRKVYDDGTIMLINLFSAGGITNSDLPPTSSYRKVTPMAMTILHKDGVTKATPWAIDYARYNDPARNGFMRAPAEIKFRAE